MLVAGATTKKVKNYQRRKVSKRNRGKEALQSFSLMPLMYMFIIGAFCTQMIMIGAGDNIILPLLEIFNVPFMISNGVWLFGFIGQKEVSLIWPIIGAYVLYPTRYVVSEKVVWILMMVLGAYLASEYKGKRKTDDSRRSLDRCTSCVLICAFIITLFQICCVYFNFTITAALTDSDSCADPFHAAMKDFYTLSWYGHIHGILLSRHAIKAY